jgi:hypothetical protein
MRILSGQLDNGCVRKTVRPHKDSHSAFSGGATSNWMQWASKSEQNNGKNRFCPEMTVLFQIFFLPLRRSEEGPEIH